MGTNCAPLVADLFLFCYERHFMMSLSDDKQVDIFDAFKYVLKRVSFGSKDCTKELKLECAYFLGQTS